MLRAKMMVDTQADPGVLHEPDWPPCGYDRSPSDKGMVAEKVIGVSMRDGVRISVDNYRLKTDAALPVLLAFAIYNVVAQKGEHMPPTHTNDIQRLRYLSGPLAEDKLIAGPAAG